MQRNPPSRASRVEFFSRALTSFQESQDVFRVVASIPPLSPYVAAQAAQSTSAAAPTPPTSTAPAPAPAPAPPKRPQNLIVLDSSFNPPTLAHLRMARSALQSLGRARTRVLLLLAVNNADKTPRPAGFAQRLGMMGVFAGELVGLGMDGNGNGGGEGDSEGGEEGVDFGIDLGLTTLPYFHAKSAAIAGSEDYARDEGGEEMEQIYLAGYDTLVRIFNPKYYTPPADHPHLGESPMAMALSPFFERSKLRITMRTDGEWGDGETQRAYLRSLAEGELEAVGGRREWLRRIELVEGRKPWEEVVSSTAVRDAVREGNMDKLGRLVTKGVREWIVEEGLYQDGDSA